LRLPAPTEEGADVASPYRIGGKFRSKGSSKACSSPTAMRACPRPCYQLSDSGTALVRNEISIVVCNDRLDDGKYEDILNLVVRSEAKVPVIVVSQTGDWPEYLAAMCVAGHLTFWLTPLSLRTFNGPSKMPCWGDSGTSKRTE
jgi:hypothetical protein